MNRCWRFLGGAALLGSGVLLGFYLALPLAALHARLLGLAEAAGWQVTSSVPTRSWPPGLAVARLQVRVPGFGAELPVEELRLTPVWSELLRGRWAVSVRARVAGSPARGELAAAGYRLHWQGREWRGTLAAPQPSAGLH